MMESLVWDSLDISELDDECLYAVFLALDDELSEHRTVSSSRSGAYRPQEPTKSQSAPATRYCHDER